MTSSDAIVSSPVYLPCVARLRLAGGAFGWLGFLSFSLLLGPELHAGGQAVHVFSSCLSDVMLRGGGKSYSGEIPGPHPSLLLTAPLRKSIFHAVE